MDNAFWLRLTFYASSNGNTTGKSWQSGSEVKNFPRSFMDGFSQFFRFQTFGIAAPAQDPALHFGEAGQFHFQFRSPALQIAQYLRRMPFLFADVIGGAGVKADDDFKFAFAGMDAET